MADARPTLGEVVSSEEKLELAALVYSPAHVALHFGRHCLQFYCRADFVHLARRTHSFYAKYSARNARVFRERLNAILRERDEPPILWEEDVA